MQMHLNTYLESSIYIDWQHPLVSAKAAELASGYENDEQITRCCFKFVRDRIKHSWDYQQNPVTCKASEVLKHGTGYCYAKSHLLAALLRANSIPAGLCYQRLSLEGDSSPFCLHGLNAVYLKKHGWYRLDARGNKPGITAAFTPPHEQLAFPIDHDLERDLPEIWPEPLTVVADVLTRFSNVIDVYHYLPDIELVSKLPCKSA